MLISTGENKFFFSGNLSKLISIVEESSKYGNTVVMDPNRVFPKLNGADIISVKGTMKRVLHDYNFYYKNVYDLGFYPVKHYIDSTIYFGRSVKCIRYATTEEILDLCKKCLIDFRILKYDDLREIYK